MPFKAIIVVFSVLFVNAACFAQEGLDVIEKKQLFDDLDKSFDRVKDALSDISGNVESDCLKAFGYKNFCQCLSRNIPLILSFQNYVRIVTSSKTDLKYDKLPDDEKKLIDITRKGRDHCVVAKQ